MLLSITAVERAAASQTLVIAEVFKGKHELSLFVQCPCVFMHL